ncbi:MAG: hypothetical protein R3A13_06560 [Bdellovibrionota bacterium]
MLISLTAFAEEGSELNAKDLTKLEQVQKLREKNLENGGKPAISNWKESGENSVMESSGKMFSGLALCLGVLLVGSGLYKRLQGKSPANKDGKMCIIEKMQVTSKTSLILCEVRGKEYLVAVGGENVSFANTQMETTQHQSKGFEFNLQEACVEKDSISIS